MKKLLRLMLVVTVVAVPAGLLPAAERARPAASAAGRPVTSEEVRAAIEKGIAWLKALQSNDGSWPYPTAQHALGASSLAVFSLSEAGLTASDRAVAKGVSFVAAQKPSMTYDAACQAMALASVDAAMYRDTIAVARDFLVQAQRPSGMWDYGNTVAQAGGDNSNTQFAILGLAAAITAGLDVSPLVFDVAGRHYTATQNGDGGWGYRPGEASRSSMTAASVGALHIIGGRLYVEAARCGTYMQDRRMAGGISWLEKNFSVTTHPGGSMNHQNYHLYALERVGVLTGERCFGTHDWYIEGARYLVDTQNEDGSWTSGRDIIPGTCFAVLFLAKGNVPVLINKLRHGGDWNADIHDAENLTRYVSARLGQRVGWQSVSAGEGVEALLSAPILYVTGHSLAAPNEAETATLKAFFENGGFMLADACCGSKDFDRGIRELAQKIFPGIEFAPLDKTEMVYRALFDLSASKRVLLGIKAGCRLNIVYAPADISCVWEKDRLPEDEEDFQFGANIAAYATGKEKLAPKLEQYRILPSKEAVRPVPGAFTFAQAMYASGTWNPHPSAGPKLLDYLNKNAGLTVSPEQVNVPLTDRNLANYPFLYMTGSRKFSLSDEEKKAIKEYVERGGFLFADAACGSLEFDASFKSLMNEVFPASPLEAIPADSPLYRIAYDTTRVRYTAAVRELNPSLDTLMLYGVKLDKRVAVVYSPYCIGFALEGFPTYGARGLVTEDAYRAATNIVLFALSH